MKTKNITICGKEITVAYCFMTEAIYKEVTGEDYSVLGQEIADCIKGKNDPDMSKLFALIYAAELAYYEKDEPFTIKDLMRKSTFDEVTAAIVTIVGLRAAFFHIPAGEPADTVPSDSPAGTEDGSKN